MIDHRVRRALIGSMAVALAVRLAWAQSAPPMRVIGWLGNSRASSGSEARAIQSAFRDEMQRRGWVEGRNVTYETRFAEGVVERLPALARELVDLQVDLIVATSGRAAIEAKGATDTIPIVFASVPQPVEQGVVASLAQPGGNATGFATMTDELIGKRLEILKQAVPGLARVACLCSANPVASDAAARAARALGLQLHVAIAPRASDLPAAIASQQDASAWFVQDHAMHFAERRSIVELIAAQRKPAIYPHAIYVEAGGLMAYAVDLKDQFRRAAGYVDRILRGTRPSELPVEQPVKFELVVNTRAARLQSIKLSPSFLARVDRVIE